MRGSERVRASTVTERAPASSAATAQSKLDAAEPTTPLAEPEREITAVTRDDEGVVSECADLVFHLLVLLKSRNLTLEDVVKVKVIDRTAVILDIFSRRVVGWRIEHAESAIQFRTLFKDAMAKHSVPPDQLTLHADRGGPMKAKATALMLADLGVPPAHIAYDEF